MFGARTPIRSRDPAVGAVLGVRVMRLVGGTHALRLRAAVKTRCQKLHAHENGRVLQLQQQCSRFHSRALPEASWSLSWGSPRSCAAFAGCTAHEYRSNTALCSAHMSRLAPRPKNLIRQQRSRKMARQACAASGGMLAASVADTRVALVSSSSIDVSVVILALSIVQDRSKVPVPPPTSEVKLKAKGLLCV